MHAAIALFAAGLAAAAPLNAQPPMPCLVKLGCPDGQALGRNDEGSCACLPISTETIVARSPTVTVAPGDDGSGVIANIGDVQCPEGTTYMYGIFGHRCIGNSSETLKKIKRSPSIDPRAPTVTVAPGDDGSDVIANIGDVQCPEGTTYIYGLFGHRCVASSSGTIKRSPVVDARSPTVTVAPGDDGSRVIANIGDVECPEGTTYFYGIWGHKCI